MSRRSKIDNFRAWSAEHVGFYKGLVAFVILSLVFVAFRAILHIYYFGGNFFGIEVPAEVVEKVEVFPASEESKLKGFIQVKEGDFYFSKSHGLFGTDFLDARNKCLDKSPIYTELSILRDVSNTVKIVVSERTAIAKILRERDNSKVYYNLDKDAVVFPKYVKESLPVITGYSPTGDKPTIDLKNSLKHDRMIRAALEFVEAINEGYIKVNKRSIKRIDVSHPESIVCYDDEGRSIILAWNDMGNKTERGRKSLVAQVEGVLAAMNTEAGRNLKFFDASCIGKCPAR